MTRAPADTASPSRSLLLTIALTFAAATAGQAQNAPDSGSSSRVAVGGRVVDAAGRPIVAADVSVDSMWHAETDQQGRFRVAAVPVGSHTMEVRAIGFEPLELDLRLVHPDAVDITVTLKAGAQPLPEVTVTAQRVHLARVGYYARRAVGRGRFIESGSLMKLHPVDFMRALTQVPGIHVVNKMEPDYIDPLPRSIAWRKGLRLVVNGWVVPDSAQRFYLRTTHPDELDAIEIYEDLGPVSPVGTGANSIGGMLQDLGIPVAWGPPTPGATSRGGTVGGPPAGGPVVTVSSAPAPAASGPAQGRQRAQARR